MPIEWYRGDPALLRAKQYVVERQLGAVRGLAGSVRGGYDWYEADRRRQQQERAALIRATARTPDPATAALLESQQNVAPGIEDESLAAGGVVGPGDEARNLSGAGVPGTGAGSTVPTETPVTRALTYGKGAVESEGPYAGDESTIIRAMRGIGAFMRIPGIKPTQAGPSTLERTAALQGEQDELTDETKRIEALNPLLRQMRKPMEGVSAFAPKTWGTFGVSPEVGGGRYPPSLSGVSRAQLIETQAEQYAIEDGRNYVTAADRARAARDFERPYAPARESQPFTEESTLEEYYVDPNTGEETSAWTPGAVKRRRQTKTRTPGGQAVAPPPEELPPPGPRGRNMVIPGTNIPLYDKVEE